MQVGGRHTGDRHVLTGPEVQRHVPAGILRMRQDRREVRRTGHALQVDLVGARLEILDRKVAVNEDVVAGAADESILAAAAAQDVVAIAAAQDVVAGPAAHIVVAVAAVEIEREDAAAGIADASIRSLPAPALIASES